MDTDRREKKTWKAEKDLAKHGHTESGRRRNDVGGSQGECGGQSGMEEMCRPMRCKRVEGLRSKVRSPSRVAEVEVSLYDERFQSILSTMSGNSRYRTITSLYIII